MVHSVNGNFGLCQNKAAGSVCPTLHEQTRVDKCVESDGAISVSIGKGLYGISMVL